MACANDRNAGLGEHIRRPAHVENQRRIVNLFQARRIRRIVERDQLNTRRGGLWQSPLDPTPLLDQCRWPGPTRRAGQGLQVRSERRERLRRRWRSVPPAGAPGSVPSPESASGPALQCLFLDCAIHHGHRCRHGCLHFPVYRRLHTPPRLSRTGLCYHQTY